MISIPDAPTHGGDVERIAAQYGFAPNDLLDFSASINPFGPPAGALRRLAHDAADVRLLMRYPDIELTALRAAISLHTGVEESLVVIANGTAALVDAAVRAVAAKRALVPVPSFSEYRRALAAANCAMLAFPLSETDGFRVEPQKFARKLAAERPHLCVITNPHNPTGALLTREALKEIIVAAHELGIIVLLDEAFIDYTPHESMADAMNAKGYHNLIILRSVTKFYGMPALRVGYAIAMPELAALLRAQIPSWAVTTLAANAACEALKDATYASDAREANALEREWLGAQLISIGLRVFPSAANFLFVELPHAAPRADVLRDCLIRRHHIVVRDCASFEGLAAGRYLRLAVHDRAGNERLVAALARELKAACAKGR